MNSKEQPQTIEKFDDLARSGLVWICYVMTAALQSAGGEQVSSNW
jgi:hypothetical protein